MHFSYPVYLHIGSLQIHPHLFFETLAYVVAFLSYLALRRNYGDQVDNLARWWVIAAATMGALVGSKVLNWFEYPRVTLAHLHDPVFLMGGKTIVGALIGGLLAVEVMKKLCRIESKTGDLFAAPLCVGIAIGRIGCFLTGLSDQTFGIATSLPWGMDFGDGVKRHPVQIYEIIFVIALGVFLSRRMRRPFREGDIFRMFMAGYLGFRLLCDFLKPDPKVFAGLASIQWACVAMLLYYARDIIRWMTSKTHIPSAPRPRDAESSSIANAR